MIDDEFEKITLVNCKQYGNWGMFILTKKGDPFTFLAAYYLLTSIIFYYFNKIIFFIILPFDAFTS